ncbi:hypothetical protein [Poseidonocella sp. HB161398]|uniref:hypothetical protein n=1 Tax=Poseidonocella sp. HB161398 TaxID=2320855 RepID=UPI0011096492|nr:hypothetical protein [Poseidonocella sp. HB161398]
MLLLTLAAGCGSPGGTVAVRASPEDLSGLLGLSYGDAVDVAQGLGYRQVRSRGATSYWSEPRSQSCARFGRSRGRLISVTMLPMAEC